MDSCNWVSTPPRSSRRVLSLDDNFEAVPETSILLVLLLALKTNINNHDKAMYP